MVAPVRFKTPCENDLSMPTREITSCHRVDRRSLLPLRRVTLRRGTPPAATTETPLAPWTDRGSHSRHSWRGVLKQRLERWKSMRVEATAPMLVESEVCAVVRLRQSGRRSFRPSRGPRVHGQVVLQSFGEGYTRNSDFGGVYAGASASRPRSRHQRYCREINGAASAWRTGA